MSVRPAKTQISLYIRPVLSESSLCAEWVAKDSMCFYADSEDSDQTGRMPRLIWVFAGRTLILLVSSCRGSFKNLENVFEEAVPVIWATSWQNQQDDYEPSEDSDVAVRTKKATHWAHSEDWSD